MVEDPENLTLAEQRIAEALIWGYVEQIRASHKLAVLGLLDEQEWTDRVQTDAGFFFGNRYARAWWMNFADTDTNLPLAIVDAINTRLSQTPVDNNRIYMSEVMAYLEEVDRTADDEVPGTVQD